MLAANIRVRNINYEKTFEQIFPLLQEKMSSETTSSMIIRLFQKLESAALPITLDIMQRMSQEAKTELIVTILNSYSAMIRDKLNEELAKNQIGRFLHVGEIYMLEQAGAISLWLSHVKVDYSGFLKEKLPRALGGFAGRFAEKHEEMALEKLYTDENRKIVLDLARNVLEQYGFSMELEDIQLMKDDSARMENAAKGETYLKLSGSLENVLLDALSGYLKDTVGSRPFKHENVLMLP